MKSRDTSRMPFGCNAHASSGRRFLALAAIGGVFALAGMARSATLEDGFAVGAGDYSLGALAGQTGTPETGSYDAPWATTGPGQSFGEPFVTATGLSYSDANGNVLNVSGGGVRMERTSGGSFQKNATVNPSGTPPSTDSVYFSGIVDLGGSGNGWFGIRVGPTSSKDVIGIGVNGSGLAEIRRNGSVAATSVGAFDVSEPVFLVGRIQADGAGGGDDLVYLYVNPLLPAEPAAASLTDNVSTRGWFPSQVLEVLELSALMITGNAPTFFDEFRIGSSWEDVTPYTAAQPVVPEPATMALLGLAACGLGGYARRRRNTP